MSVRTTMAILFVGAFRSRVIFLILEGGDMFKGQICGLGGTTVVASRT